MTTATTTLVHADYDPVTHPLASGSTKVTVGQYDQHVGPSGGTLDLLGIGTFQITGGTNYYIRTGLTFMNRSVESVSIETAELWYSWYDAGIFTEATLTSDANLNFTDTGTTTMVVWDYNALAFDSTETGGTYYITVV